ncbi:MAG: hypothetical protein OK438_06380 [Thaumarchaeota archaeon]|nr:hypothetical protein [Nitrososphaerota archaeon]
MQPEGPTGSSVLQDEAVRIVDAGKETGVPLRIHAAVAIAYHCPRYRHIMEAMGRRLGDIDLASYDKFSSRIPPLIDSLGYQEDVTVSAFGGRRLVFRRRGDGLHCDVFLGKLEMSHTLSFEGRLEIDYPTLPLADLLLSKMQIFRLNQKDVVDTVVLLREHAVGGEKPETVDALYVSRLCSRDWGLWRTVTGNLAKVSTLLKDFASLDDWDKADVNAKIDDLKRALEDSPKSLSWKVRARVGESRKWYNDVEDLYRG